MRNSAVCCRHAGCSSVLCEDMSTSGLVVLEGSFQVEHKPVKEQL